MTPTLMIADGDPELCRFYRLFFIDRGYDVETASDGLECLRKLRRFRPAVLVLDRELRWGGGDGVLAWLREEGAVSGVAVVLTSADGAGLGAAEDVGPPVVRFLPKPFPLTTLLETVRAAVAEKGRAEPFNLKRAVAWSEFLIG